MIDLLTDCLLVVLGTWTIFKTSAIKGEGITDGLEWLTTQIVA